MYPCEDCGYQGQYIISLQNQIHEAHSITSEVEKSNNLDDHDMVRLPVYSNRIKQTFPGLIIDALK